MDASDADLFEYSDDAHEDTGLMKTDKTIARKSKIRIKVFPK